MVDWLSLHLFSFKFSRSVPGLFKENVKTSQGIGLWRFGGDPMGLANVSVNPDNIGFCTPTRENCLGAGLVNISSCETGEVYITHRKFKCSVYISIGKVNMYKCNNFS